MHFNIIKRTKKKDEALQELLQQAERLLYERDIKLSSFSRVIEHLNEEIRQLRARNITLEDRIFSVKQSERGCCNIQ